MVKDIDKEKYLSIYNPVQLRWNVNVNTGPDYSVLNFGECKGKTIERVLIYPTEDMKRWMHDHSFDLKSGTGAKLYVAITRAKYSVAIVADFRNDIQIEGISIYNPNDL